LNDARQVFGLTLRTQREQLGIPIQDIAESTKISVALLTALERGDVSKWPRGIFRRAFFREYVCAIGLSPDALSSDFARLFPEEPAAPAPPAGELRLALAPKESPAAAVLRRVAVVTGELAVLSLVSVASTWVVAIEMLPAMGLAALVYYPAANLCVDRKWGFAALRAIAKSPLPAAQVQQGRYEEIDGREELQVSF
jgi:transcriptional regulator with XRE-family HTH domain